MELLSVLGALIEVHGPWISFCVVEGIVIVILARYIVKVHEAQREDDKITISMLESFKASVEALTKAMDRLIDKLDRTLERKHKG